VAGVVPVGFSAVGLRLRAAGRPPGRPPRSAERYQPGTNGTPVVDRRSREHATPGTVVDPAGAATSVPTKEVAMSEHRDARVVVGVSQSLAGLQALRYGVAEAQRRRVPLHAVRAWRFDVAWRGPDVRRWRREIAQEALKYVGETFKLALGGLPIDVDVNMLAAEGRPDQVLTEMAASPGDLIVVGGHGGRWPSWLRTCMRRSACPVAVVPPPEIARTARPAILARRLLRETERFTETAGRDMAGAH
jgi:nucleotide-binding universal stress UspA family protein